MFLIALLAASAAYAGLLLIALAWPVVRMSARSTIDLIAIVQGIVFAGPILSRQDIFSDIAYARMGVEHGMNPFPSGRRRACDPVYRYVGVDWRRVATAYGPVYTLISYPLAPLGVVGALWGLKVLARLASLGTMALTWRCARRRGLDPAIATAAVGANRCGSIYGLGGAHNDLMMMLMMMLAVSLRLATPRGAGARSGSGSGVVVGRAVKATAVAVLPFMISRAVGSRRCSGRSRRWRAVALVGSCSRSGCTGWTSSPCSNRDATYVSSDSFANEVAHLFGNPGVYPVEHAARGWRWCSIVAAADVAPGGAMTGSRRRVGPCSAIAVTRTWLLAWYLLWALPLAVLSRDRRLLIATVVCRRCSSSTRSARCWFTPA